MSLQHQALRHTLTASDFSDTFWSNFKAQLHALPGTCMHWRAPRASTTSLARPRVSVRTKEGRQLTVHPRVLAALQIERVIPKGLAVVSTCRTPDCVEHVSIEARDGTRRTPRAPDATQEDDVLPTPALPPASPLPFPVDTTPRKARRQIIVYLTEEEHQIVLRAAAVYFHGPPNLSGFARNVILAAARADGFKPTVLERKEAIAQALQAQLNAYSSPLAAYQQAQEEDFAGPTPIEKRMPVPPAVEKPVMAFAGPPLPDGLLVPPPAWPSDVPMPDFLRPASPPIQPPTPVVPLRLVPEAPPTIPTATFPTFDVPTLPRPTWLEGYDVPMQLPPLDDMD